jgi:hypothetical protein
LQCVPCKYVTPFPQRIFVTILQVHALPEMRTSGSRAA